MGMNVSSAASPAAPTQAPESTGRLAALRALQKAIEAQKPEEAAPADNQDGKGRLLDLRC
jgi:hypothetical protein